MNNWFNSLSARERNLVTFGSIIVFTVLFWLLAIKPLYNKHNSLNSLIQEQQITLKTMQQQSLQVKQLKLNASSNIKKVSNQNPQQVIERALQTWRLKTSLERMQSQGLNGVRLLLKEANADRFLRFLYELEDQYGLIITNLAITKGKETGTVDIRLNLTGNDKQ